MQLEALSSDPEWAVPLGPEAANARPLRWEAKEGLQSSAASTPKGAEGHEQRSVKPEEEAGSSSANPSTALGSRITGEPRAPLPPPFPSGRPPGRGP